jgi:ribose transport system ATP-binding protein
VNLDLRRGEILGVGGTVGAGRTSLLRLIFGDVARLGGSISMEGKEVRLRSPRDAMKAGIAYLPENRVRDAGFMSLGLSENLSAATLQRYTSAGWLKRSEERADARNDLRTLRVRAPSIFAPLQSLSGGNQQKIVLARWLRMTTKVLLLDEPTQGVDAGARADIYDLITRAAADGLAVVVVSSDFEELAALCDRVVVLADGRLVAEGQKPSVTADWIAHHTHAATAARSSW